MTQMPAKLVDVVSVLETLTLPYVLYRDDSGSHRILVEASSETDALKALVGTLESAVVGGIRVVVTKADDAVEFPGPHTAGSRTVIEVQPRTGRSAASMLWWLALQEGSKAARDVAHADPKPLNILVNEPRASHDNPA
jgi:hypothetical protein